MGILQKCWQGFVLIALLVLNGLVLKFITTNFAFLSTQHSGKVENECTIDPSCVQWGFDTRYFAIIPLELKYGQTFSDLFSKHNFSEKRLHAINENVAEFISLKALKTGKHYAFVYSNPSANPDYLIYEPNPYQYLVSDLNQNGCSQLIDKEFVTKEENLVGVIKTNLWDALQENGVSLNIIDQMEDALSCSLNFHQIQTGNTFKLIYTRNYVENIPTNDGQLIAAYFQTEETEYFSIRYKVEGKAGFYDLAGRPMKRSFLSAPLRFYHISSPYSTRRFHPILKFHRAHLGTDYAAPHGTPIMAVGDGVIEAAHYAGGNGNFVKIRHDKTYQTQYLHMSRFASGIRPGVHVKQGQTIGYVGSTGLATGPHVCFRFWKNGRQVDHRKLKFPSPQPLPKELLPQYFAYRDTVLKKLAAQQLPTASGHLPPQSF